MIAYHRLRRFTRPLALLLLVVAAGCGEGISEAGEGEAIARQAFIDTMVELRLTAYQANNDGILPGGAHEAVLARHGVSVDDMIGFVEVHGRDIPFMEGVWTEIDGHIRAALQARLAEMDQNSAAPQ